MKKYVLIISSIVSFHTDAMEVADTIAASLPHINYETEQEFVERTRLLKTHVISEKYRKHLPSTKSYDQWMHSASCPNNKIIAILQHETSKDVDKHGREKSKVTLVVIKKQKNKLLHRTHLDDEQYFNIAVSRDGNIIGAIYPHTMLSQPHLRTTNYEYTDELIIMNLVTKEKEFYQIPYKLQPIADHPTIAFNKQGTDIIIHGKERSDDKSHIDETPLPSRYEIHPLIVHTSNPDYTEVLGECIKSAVSSIEPHK